MANITHPIPDTRPTEPYFQISESNSLIFAMVQEYNNTSIYQNVFNEKACQANTQISEGWTHEYQINDVVTTQIWSNYTNIDVNQHYLDETSEVSEVVKRVENIGNQDSRDAKTIGLDKVKNTFKIQILNNSLLGDFFRVIVDQAGNNDKWIPMSFVANGTPPSDNNCVIGLDIEETIINLKNSIDNNANYTGIYATEITNTDTLEVKIIEEGLTLSIDFEDLGSKAGLEILDVPTKTGIYFESGNLYEFDSEVVIGTYELNGLVPKEFSEVGNWVYLTAIGWFQIESIQYDSVLNASLLTVDVDGFVVEDIIIASQYNTKPYDVYEFDLYLNPLASKEDNIMNVSILNSDTRDLWVDIKYSSEKIRLIDHDNQTKEIIWFNYFNSANLYFADNNFYGILRLPFILYKEGSDTETQTEITGNTSFTTSSRNIHKKILSLDYVTAQMFRKLTEISTHEEVFVDRIQYTVDKINYEEIGTTNTYSFEIELNSAEQYYNPLADRLYCGNRRIGIVYTFDSLEWDFSSTKATFDSN